MILFSSNNEYKINYLQVIPLSVRKYLNDKILIQFNYQNTTNSTDVNNTKNNLTLFCFIKTHPNNFATRLPKSYNNCIQYCTDYRYVTIYDNKTLNLKYKFIFPNNWNREDYGKLTTKVYNGFLQTKTLQLFDWYLFADDDTFINMKNLFYFLNDKKSSQPIQYGHHFGAIGGFLSGGAGYIFSQEAYKRLINKLSHNISSCPNSGIDDLDLSKCLQSVNVTIGDSRDDNGYERFHPGDFEHHYFDPPDVGYPQHKQFNGKRCCSKTWITFHEKNMNHFDQMIQLVDDILIHKK